MRHKNPVTLDNKQPNQIKVTNQASTIPTPHSRPAKRKIHQVRQETTRMIAQYMMILTLLLGGSGITGGMTTTAYGAAATGASKTQAYEHMVFLGDSLTVGYEPGIAAADYDGFAPRLEEQELFRGHAQADNAGILGLTSTGLKHYMDAITAGRSVSTADIQSTLPGATRTLDGAATRKEIQAADLITITIGGNDFLNALGSLTALPQDLSQINLQPVLNTYRTNLGSILDQLTTLNPNAVIVIADQYQPVPLLAGATLYHDLNETAAEFSSIIDDTVSTYTTKGNDIRVAHVSPSFQGKELAMTHIAAGDIHPNATGYQAMAVAFSIAIWGETGYMTPASAVNGTDQTILYTNGKLLQSQSKPIIRSGRTYVALRDVTTALGAEVSWSSTTKQATVTNGSSKVMVPLNSKILKVNNQSVTTDAAAFMQQNKVYVPIAVLADQFAYDVHYVNRWKAVFIRQ
ncbi:stalk domain-containing protein [Paenibacillus sp. WLX2291]|uniref:stalk domain-containing protein n=1 Tax=Paenibacillus sp. WLX2291 TaxID=3296934 RepID=UPI00398429C8